MLLPLVGAGHVTRCLALAEALIESGWRVAFAVGRDTTAMMPAIAAETFALMELRHEAKGEPAALRSRFPDGVDLLVVDHYERDVAFERACRGWARRILVMDDGTGRHHDCDLLVDSAASNPSPYAGCVAPPARLLLGPAYALIRRSFVERRPIALQRRNADPVKNILVSFGATDPLNAAPAALAALACFANNVAITVAMSSRAQHIEAVRARLPSTARLVLDADMAELMTEADLAVGAAGASAFERAVLGLPSIMLILAENQRGVANMLIEAGAAAEAGPFDAGFCSRVAQLAGTLIETSAARLQMAEAASQLVDGRGPQRVLLAIAGGTRARDGSTVRLRLAEPDDEKWLLELQRAPETRRYFRTPSVPSANDHACWMRRTMTDPGVLLCVIDVDGENAGTVRLDRRFGNHADPTFEVSIAVCPTLYGRGIGSAALALARRLHPLAVLDAEILAENIASKSLFTRAGYSQVDATRYRQQPS